MKKLITLVMIAALVFSCFVFNAAAEDYDYADLRPDPEGSDAKISVEGATIEVAPSGTARITLTGPQAVVLVTFKDDTGVYEEAYADVNFDMFVKYFYEKTDGITSFEILAHYARGDKDNADLYLTGMEANPSYYVVHADDLTYGAWNIGQYLQEREAKGYLPEDGVIKFNDISFRIDGTEGDVFTIYNFELCADVEDDFGEVIPEDDPDILPDESEEEPEESSEAPAPITPAGKGENIAKGKSYTVDGVEKLRGDSWDDTNGTKLTDGEKLRDQSASSAIYGINAKEAEIVIDLGEKTDIAAISSDLFGGTWGITDPVNAVAKFFVSDDGETFTDYATVNGDEAECVLDVQDSWKIRIFEAEKAASARYVKVQFIIPEGVPAFTWISEIEVFAPAADEPIEEPSEEPSKEESKEESKPAPTPKTGDNGMIALAVISVITLAGVVVVKKSK